MNGSVNFHAVGAVVNVWAVLFSYRGESQCGSHLGAGHSEHTADWTAAGHPDHPQEKAPADGSVS